jgi:arsenate reductase
MNVLFVCTANGGRSVISERLLEREAGDRHHARSAGSRPGTGAHPEVVDALRELGIDACDHVPQKLSQELIDWADVVVATCDDSCPYVPGKRYANWQLPDPKGQPIERVREIRDDIATRVAALVRDLDGAAAGA